MPTTSWFWQYGTWVIEKRTCFNHEFTNDLKTAPHCSGSCMNHFDVGALKEKFVELTDAVQLSKGRVIFKPHETWQRVTLTDLLEIQRRRVTQLQGWRRTHIGNNYKHPQNSTLQYNTV